MFLHYIHFLSQQTSFYFFVFGRNFSYLKGLKTLFEDIQVIQQ